MLYAWRVSSYLVFFPNLNYKALLRCWIRRIAAYLVIPIEVGTWRIEIGCSRPSVSEICISPIRQILRRSPRYDFSFMCSHPRSAAIKSPHMPHLLLHVHGFDFHAELPYLVPSVGLAEQIFNDSRLCYFLWDVPSTWLAISGPLRFSNAQLQGLLSITRVSAVLLPNKQCQCSRHATFTISVKMWFANSFKVSSRKCFEE